jgi:hypothetical protein
VYFTRPIAALVNDPPNPKYILLDESSSKVALPSSAVVPDEIYDCEISDPFAALILDIYWKERVEVPVDTRYSPVDHILPSGFPSDVTISELPVKDVLDPELKVTDSENALLKYRRLLVP